MRSVLNASVGVGGRIATGGGDGGGGMETPRKSERRGDALVRVIRAE